MGVSNVRKTTEQFVEEAETIHGNKYDYSKVEYKNNKTKICIVCPEHGVFWQSPSKHLSGQGCPKCKGSKISESLTSNTEEFIQKARQLYGNRYDYSKVEYKNNFTKVCIICPKHGSFLITPKHHLRGEGCPHCGKELSAYKQRLSKEEFIQKANQVHSNKYNYSKIEFTNTHSIINIMCPKHGEFVQRADHHLYGCGCPLCNSSQGERKIREILNTYNIAFEEQKRFETCKHKYTLAFDFYLPNYNLCIEYQGEQHFKPARFGTKEEEKEKLLERQTRDEIKRAWCLKEENPGLLEINYNENIEEKLLKELKLDE